jgi:hypothetical protein
MCDTKRNQYGPKKGEEFQEFIAGLNAMIGLIFTSRKLKN